MISVFFVVFATRILIYINLFTTSTYPSVCRFSLGRWRLAIRRVTFNLTKYFHIKNLSYLIQSNILYSSKLKNWIMFFILYFIQVFLSDVVIIQHAGIWRHRRRIIGKKTMVEKSCRLEQERLTIAYFLDSQIFLCENKCTKKKLKYLQNKNLPKEYCPTKNYRHIKKKILKTKNMKFFYYRIKISPKKYFTEKKNKSLKKIKKKFNEIFFYRIKISRKKYFTEKKLPKKNVQKIKILKEKFSQKNVLFKNKKKI